MKTMKHAAESKRIEALRTDYESVIKNQKERILQLREENAELNKTVSELESRKTDMVNALMDARAKSEEILRDAQARAKQILKEAEEEKLNAQKLTFLYQSSLKDLENRSQRILRSIQKELSADRTPNIRIISQ